MNWLHRLFNPHCPECEAKDLNPVIEELKIELTSLRYERDRLLKYILDEPKHNIQLQQPETPDEEPILPKIIPWSVRKQMLEAEDHKKAQLIKQNRDEQAQALAIAELEKNLGIIENTVLQVGEEDVQSEPVKING